MKHGIPPKSRLNAALLCSGHTARLQDRIFGGTGFLVGQEMFGYGHLGFWGLKRPQFCCLNHF